MLKKSIRVPLAEIEIEPQIYKIVKSVLDSKKFILGNNTKSFEKEFAEFCGVKYAACVSSGTAALFLSLSSLDVKKGDEIIVPSMSFIATVTPILMLGAKPRFVDVNYRSCTIEVDQIEDKINKKTKGIIPVHLYGHAANMGVIQKIAKKHSLFVIEDAAQAHGANFKTKKAGSMGDLGCFSFYPSKNLTVCGDGGIVVSNNNSLIDKIKMLRNHGRNEKYLHRILGYNLRFNEIQAAIGRIMLKKLSKNNEKRRKIANRYNEELCNDVIKPIEEKWAKHVFHMYTIRVSNRDKLQKFLNEHNIGTGIHYPIPIHKQPLLKEFNKVSLPNTEKISKSTLSIPMFPKLTESQQKHVINTINKFVS